MLFTLQAINPLKKIMLKIFCEELNKVLAAGDFIKSFTTWNDVYSFLKNAEIKERLVLIIDEFTYLYNSNPAYDSELQNAIDKILKLKNIFLILCGSEVSVIEEIIDNSTKPPITLRIGNARQKTALLALIQKISIVIYK